MKTRSGPQKNANHKVNTAQPFFSRKHSHDNSFFSSNVTTPQAPVFFTSTSRVQKKSPGSGRETLSLVDAKRIILKATKGWGTDESAIYDAIRRCDNRKSLMSDVTVISALSDDMGGHELWKCYLLMEYGSERAFPSSIKKLWSATSGAGTDESAVFSALESMSKREKKSFGLEYILREELSGDELQKSLDLIVTADSISGNVYGGQDAAKEQLVVNEENLRELIDSQFVGAASEGLKNVMLTLYGKPTGDELKEVLARVESIRGLVPGSALAQYNKAMAKQKAGIEYYKNHFEEPGRVYDPVKDNPSPPLDVGQHDTFTASNAQLRFGKVVGDAFGIDAVFGSLISPTGGMAGPGNERVPLVKDGGAVATHGAVHDAAGYLYNCHGIGPGYDYLQTEPGSDPSNPLAGQTNMKWWIKEFDKTDNDVQWFERFLNSKAHIGAAFSKHYEKLNTAQKKDALKVMSETTTFILKRAGISNTDRVNRISDLMDSCSASEKTELANYFYNHDGFLTVSGVYNLMRPHVSQEVYRDYIRRRMARFNSIQHY